MQPGLELEEVKVAPVAADPVVNTLIGRTTAGATQPLGSAVDLEVDASLGGVEIDLDDLPRSLQPQGSGVEGLDLNLH